MLLTAAAAVTFATLVACVPPQYRGARVYYGSDMRRKIVEEARQHVGTPYRYGGESPGGFDCSGLVGWSYRRNGLRLPRVSRQMARVGRRVATSRLRPADILLFRTGGRGISHAGLYIGGGRMVHASSSRGRVVVVRLAGWYRSHLVTARRVIR